CGKENQEINFGREFIKDLYNVDKPSVDINNSSVEDLIKFQNRFSSYFTEEEFTSLASIDFFFCHKKYQINKIAKFLWKTFRLPKRPIIKMKKQRILILRSH